MQCKKNLQFTDITPYERLCFFEAILLHTLSFYLYNTLATTHSRALQPTWWRLHAGGGFTKVRAGDTLPNSHKTVCGHTQPLA